MNFKRKEGFRFIFNEPVEAHYKLYVNGQSVHVDHYPGKILDISPGGMKLSCGGEVGDFIMDTTLKVEINFVLDVTSIRALGEIMWNKKFGSTYQCGIMFDDQGDLGDLIISEMKIRRKKEVLKSKRK